jgi:MSHA biogenesis protein MshI
VLLSRRRTPLPGWVGCAPQGARAAFACVERSGAALPVVRWVRSAPWTDAAGALKALRRSHALHRHRSVALLARGHYQLLATEAPDLPRAEWAQALRWRLKDSLDFAADSATIQLLELPAGTSHRPQPQLLAVAAPPGPLATLAQAGEQAGARWSAIDIVETALRNVCSLASPPEQVQALLHLDADASQLVVTLHGELLLSRSIELGTQALEDGDEVQRRAAFDRAGLELQRTLDSFERQFNQVSLARLLIAPAAVSAELCAHLRELLSVPVAELDLAGALDTRAVPELADAAQMAAYLCAIGAALRDD